MSAPTPADAATARLPEMWWSPTVGVILAERGVWLVIVLPDGNRPVSVRRIAVLPGDVQEVRAAPAFLGHAEWRAAQDARCDDAERLLPYLPQVTQGKLRGELSALRSLAVHVHPDAAARTVLADLVDGLHAEIVVLTDALRGE